MPQKRKPNPHDIDYSHAAWYAFREPRSTWINEAACGTAPVADLPDGEGGREGKGKVARFVGKYCGNCSVKVECVLAPVGTEAYNTSSVYGGMRPSVARRVIFAIEQIESYGTLDAAAAGLGKDLTPLPPSHSLENQYVPPQIERPAE
jgi:hypothetical protein